MEYDNIIISLEDSSEQSNLLKKIYENRKPCPLMIGDLIMGKYNVTHYDSHAKRDEDNGELEVTTAFHLFRVERNDSN